MKGQPLWLPFGSRLKEHPSNRSDPSNPTDAGAMS